MSTPKAYHVRSGATDLGRDYEYNMTALLCVRCIAQNVEDMWIVSNCDKVGAFDDVVLKVRRPGGNSATFMIQLKHKAKPTNITKEEFVPIKNPNAKKTPKGDFFLEKYLKDIKDLKKKIETRVGGVVGDVGAFSDVQFVIFTNRDVYAYDFLESVRPSALLNTNNAEVYKFDFVKLSLLDPFFNASDCGTNLFLYPKQLHVTAVAKEIEGEIKNIFGTLGVKLVNAENIAHEFMVYVTSWAKGDLGKHYYLTNFDVGKLYELFFRQFEVNLSLQRFTYYDCPKKLMWNEVVRDQDLILVDVDDLTLQFLLDYVGSEVKKVCNQGQFDNWRDPIAEADQNSFYRPENEELKWQFLKVVRKRKTVNGVDVYRTMTMMKQIPLLLKINNPEEYESILRVLLVSDFKVILINCAGSLKQPANIKCFGTLQDLPQESSSKILDLPVKLQGRSTLLRELVNEDICKLIKCKDVINILLGNFNIGNEFPDLPPYFVKRSIAKVLIHSKNLQKNVDDIILIEDNGGDLPALKYEEIDFKGAKGAIIAVGLEYITREQKQHIMESGGKNVHYFKVYDTHHFEWKWSLGSIEFLEPFRIQTIHEGFNDDLDDYLNNDLNVISAPPGMGKTFLMNCLAHQACRSSWVLRINLNASKHREYYRNTNHNQSSMHLRFFNTNQLNENNSNSALAQAVFEELMQKKKIITIFDGFDEISYTSIEQVTKIAITLHHDGFPLWITTRPQGKTHLQSKFNTFVLNLKPFDLSDKYFFLRRYFRDLNPELDFDTSLLKKFINQLLEAARNSLEKRDTSFTGIPLQLKMLAEVFNDDCVRYVNHNGVGAEFSEDFDLLSLYEKLVNKKMKIVCDKFGWRTADLVSEFKHQQALLAFKFLYPYKCLEGSYVQEQLGDFLWKHLELLQMDGIMSVDGKRKISCVHRTFAEYLVAQFIVNNLNNPDERVGEIINFALRMGQFVNDYSLVLDMFDLMVLKGSSSALRSLHLAIRKHDPIKIKDIIEIDPNVLSERDASGRSFVHLLGLNATKFPFPYDPNYVPTHKYKSDGFADIIATISKTALTLEKDLLGFTPLYYAVSNRSLHIAAALCDVAPTTYSTNELILPFNSEEDAMACLKYSLQLNAELLYSILLPYFAFLKFFNFPDKPSHTVTYRFPVVSTTNELEVSEASVVELLQTEFGSRYSAYANGCYSNLYLAMMLGSKANVQTILNSNRTCINQTFFNIYTPLTFAAEYGKVDIIDDLLSAGAKINMQNIAGFNALLFAIEGLTCLKIEARETAQPYIDIIKKLIRCGSNLNTQNVSGNMCLHELFCYHENNAESILSEVREKTILQLVELFIDHGVNVNIRNRNGCTPLHLAAVAMLDQCVEYLLDNGADVNAVDFNGNSALCLVIYEGNKLIIEEGRRIIANGSYNSIHSWLNNQKETIARILLKRGANVNHQNNNGYTAWAMAWPLSETPGCKDLEVLSEHGADASIASYGDSLPLYANTETRNGIVVITGGRYRNSDIDI